MNNDRKEDSSLTRAYEKGITNIADLIKERESYERVARELQPLISDFNKAVISENVGDARTLMHDLVLYINNLSYRGLTDFNKKPLSTEVDEWLRVTTGDIHYSMIDKDLLLVTKGDKKNRSQILTRKVQKGELRHIKGRHGWYRKATPSEEIEWWTASTTPMDIFFPLGEHGLVEVYPSNIIAIAGEKSAGKTTWCLNFAKQNRNKYKIKYFNSEMGRHELKKRLTFHKDMTTEEWRKIDFFARPKHFDEEVDPHVINIIDFLMLKQDKTFKVGDYIEEIHEAMKGGQGLAIVALQKDWGKAIARGGPSSLDIPRLYLTLNKGTRQHNSRIKIFEAKSWKDINPNGMIREYKIKKGAELIGLGEWHDEY